MVAAPILTKVALLVEMPNVTEQVKYHSFGVPFKTILYLVTLIHRMKENSTATSQSECASTTQQGGNDLSTDMSSLSVG